MKNDYRQYVHDFVSKLIEEADGKSLIHINCTNDDVLIDPNNQLSTKIETKKVPFGIDYTSFCELFNGYYDLIIGGFPIGSRNIIWKEKSSIVSHKHEYNLINASVRNLNENGIGVFVVAPALWSHHWKDFYISLSKSGLAVEAIFNIPEGTYAPYIKIGLNLLIISRRPTQNSYMADFAKHGTAEQLARDYFECKATGQCKLGFCHEVATFKGFTDYYLNQEIDHLKIEYSEYSHFTLSEIATDINIGKHNSKHMEIPNSIYIPKVGKPIVRSCIKELTMKHQNYHQVVLNPDIVYHKYAELFYLTDFGTAIIKSLYHGETISHTTKESILSGQIALPPIDEQKRMVDVSNKVNTLQSFVAKISRELSINPRNAHKIEEKVDDLLKDFSALSEVDDIKAIIRKGESRTVEFKQTLSLDIRKNTHAKYIELEVLKNIAAFLNTDGGTLLIGVADSGKITGIEEEIPKLYKNNDKYLLHLKDIVKHNIGEGFYPLIDYNVAPINDLTVLKINVKMSDAPCYVNGKEFYVRVNPATDKLEGPQMVDYIQRHFNKK